MKHLKEITDFELLINEEDGGGGVAMANAGTTTGMGNVVSAQPSTQIGSTIGSNTVGGTYGGDGIVGSGDVGRPLMMGGSQKSKGKKGKKSNLVQTPKVMDYQTFLSLSNNVR